MEKISYLAGIIDGEGTVNITYLKLRKEYRLRLYVVNTDRRLIDWLYNNFGGLMYVAKRHRLLHPEWKEKYEWFYIPAKDKTNLLKSLLPYLICKKEQIQIAIDFLNTVSTSGKRLSLYNKNIRKNLHEKLKKLNTRAVATTE